MSSKSRGNESSEGGALAPSVVREGFALLRALSEAAPSDWASLRQRAAGCIERFDLVQEELRQEHRHRLAPERSVDAWILDIFSATESAISREQLVADFISRYRSERKLIDHEKHAGPWLFEFETTSDEQDGFELRGAHSAGVHGQAFQQLCSEHLSAWRDDPYLSAVFANGSDVDAWHPLWFGPSPLFNRLLNIANRYKGEPDYWVNAVVLPGTRHGTRGLFLLYPNAGPLDDPSPPPGMKQDARLLIVLSLAWRQLEHQIKALSRMSEAERREMIQLLAPGILHHEIGATMNSLYGQASVLFERLRGLAQANPQHPVLDSSAREAYHVASNVHRLFSITDAFNTLDKRAAVEETVLDRLCEQVWLLLQHRLGVCAVELIWPREAFRDITLTTDVVMLTQAILNLVNNAINAIDEGHTQEPRRIAIDARQHDSNKLVLAICNNGPAISSQHARHLFTRGYTTRVQGHGQGLYLSRLIARYLGGELQLAKAREGFQVEFQLSVARRLPAAEGVARANL